MIKVLGENPNFETRTLFTKETTCCGELIVLVSDDSERWFSDPADIRVFELRKQKTELHLRPHPDRNLPMTRFAF